jgi:hypothetical protein
MSSRFEEQRLVPPSDNTEAHTQEARTGAKTQRRVQWARGTSRGGMSSSGVTRSAPVHSEPDDDRGKVEDSIAGVDVDVHMAFPHEQQDGLEITPAMLAAVRRLGTDPRSREGASRSVLSLDEEGLDVSALFCFVEEDIRLTKPPFEFM